MGRREMCSKLAFLWVFLFNLLSLAYCSVIYNITSSTPLLPGQILDSPNQTFELGFFTPNNSHFQYVGIWFKEVLPRTVVWVANRDNPITNSSASLTIGRDGNLWLLDGKQNIVWSTNVSYTSKNSIGLLSDEGVFALWNSETGDKLWDCYLENPTDSMLPGKWLVFNETDRYIGSLNSWRSDNDPSPGVFTANILPQTPPLLVVSKGSKPYWRGGPWDKTKFIGIPELSTDSESGLHTGNGTGLFDVQILRDCNYNMFKITSKGILSLLCWTRQRGWYPRWGAPASPCEVYGACGPFGVCQRYDPNLTCRCLKGFVPKSNEEWMKGNWSGGCVRQSELNCGRNTSVINTQGGNPDGFSKIGGLMLPDSYNVLNDLNETECQQQCISNCSCSGYAFVSGIGCLIWGGSLVDMRELPFGGQDLFLRLAYSELDKGDGNTKTKVKTIVSIVTVLSAAIVAALIYGLRLRAKKKLLINDQIDSSSSRDKSQEFMWRSSSGNKDSVELPLFDFNSILVATNNFSTENKLGQGGYGPVYKGKLPDGKDVAIKRLSSSSGQGLQEFKNEVMLISKLKHRNLVRFIGCCVDREERILIYEYMPNKSLDTCLFDPARKAELDWKERMNIIHGVAKGLLYLHRDSCLRVIHRDLKASNILLDEKMNPKISDFGLSKIFEGTEVIGSTRRVVGTIGYMAPEYLLGGIFSEKSDVFGFGILILEIISGRRVNSFQNDNQYMNLVTYAWQCLCESNGLDMVDQALGKSFSKSNASRCVNIGLLCVQDNAADRPTMAAIVSMLNDEKAKLPQPKQPAYAFQNVSTNSTMSVNNLTLSTIEAR